MGLPLHRLSLAEYLAWESEQAERNEFFKGETLAIMGGRVVANLMRHLGNHLDDTPCQALGENMKVQVGDEAVLHPDVLAIYRKLASLREYVLVDPDTRRVELYRPHADGTATFVDMSDHEELALESIDCRIALNALFKGMDSEPGNAP